MRVVLFVVLLVFNPIILRAQKPPEWLRVYTFDESTVDMNTSIVSLISANVSRVRFRWTFNQLQSLRGVPNVKYQSELQVMEFDCSAREYRPYHLTFFDAAGNIVRIDDSPGKWTKVRFGSMVEKLFVPGCELIRKKTRVTTSPEETARLKKVTQFAYDFGEDLEKEKDFKPLIDRFFVANYLDGYLHDRQTNWFLNLNRETAALLSRQELQRFYVALMNAGYLNSLYLISQLPPDTEDPASVENLVPPDVLQLVRNHPYTARYKVRDGDYDFLGENVDSVERLRTYTDLLEQISSLMREHVKRVRAAEGKEWQAMLQKWHLYEPSARVCGENCFGLPAGTRLFDVNVAVFRLQVAEIKGTLKVVSATNRF